MDKNRVVAIENFNKISTSIMSDAAIVGSENGGVVYARVSDHGSDYGVGILIAGNTSPMVYGIANIIIKMSRRTGFSIPGIISAIIDMVNELESEVQ